MDQKELPQTRGRIHRRPPLLLPDAAWATPAPSSAVAAERLPPNRRFQRRRIGVAATPSDMADVLLRMMA
jgi:hypothetical protein